MKKTVNIILGLFIAASLIYVVVTELGSTETELDKEKTENVKNDETKQADRLDIYYFHTTARCNSCLKIEKYTKAAVESGFKDELKSGKVVFKIINIDESENKHFIKDYELYTKSVIVQKIVKGKPGKWVNLEKVWELLGNEAQFSLYIQDEVKKMTEAGS